MSQDIRQSLRQAGLRPGASGVYQGVPSLRRSLDNILSRIANLGMVF